MSCVAIPERFPCGKLKKSKKISKVSASDAAVREALIATAPTDHSPLQLAETEYVARQPHRGGDRSTKVGSELGKFILVNFIPELVGRADEIEDYRRETFEAAEGYARDTWHWNMQKGIPMPECLAWDFELGAPDEDKVEERLRKWMEQIKECEDGMKRAGQAAFLACRNLILFDRVVPARAAGRWLPARPLVGPVRRALQGLHAVVYKPRR